MITVGALPSTIVQPLVCSVRVREQEEEEEKEQEEEDTFAEKGNRTCMHAGTNA